MLTENIGDQVRCEQGWKWKEHACRIVPRKPEAGMEYGRGSGAEGQQ